MAICHFCKRVDFKNGQAVRAHLRACQAYQDREEEEQLYKALRSLGAIGISEPQVRAFEARQAPPVTDGATEVISAQ